MMLPWSWSSSPSITLPQSSNATATTVPSISFALIKIRNSLDAHSRSRNFPFPSNRSSGVRALNCCATSSSSVEQEMSSSAMVFIKGMAGLTTEGQLRKVFSEFGEVTRFKIVRDEESGQSLGYGFIWFSSKESVHLAAREMNGKFFHGRFVLVTEAKPGLPRRQYRTKPQVVTQKPRDFSF